MLRLFLLFLVMSPFAVHSQHSCNVFNLWQNGDFESSNLTCQKNNPSNAYWDQSDPWKGYTLMRWQPTYDLQPSYLEEVDFDHTLGTKYGHYYYLDPRAKSGWNYEFQQDIQVEKNTNYTFSMWYCSMNKSGNPEASIRLIVNNSDITGTVKITNVNHQWKQITGTWNSGNNFAARAALQTLNADVSGHDFAIDDIVFSSGKLWVYAGNDTTLCSNSIANLGSAKGAQYGVSCDKGYAYSWQPSSNLNGSNKVANPQLKTPIIPGKYVLTVTDYNGNNCTDTVNISVSNNNGKLLNLFPDTLICKGTTANFRIPSNYSNPVWNDGSTAMSRTFTDSGLFWVDFKDVCSNFSDTFRISYYPEIEKFYLADSSVCAGESIIRYLPAANVPNVAQWFDGSKLSPRIFTTPGIYWAVINSPCDAWVDSFELKLIQDPKPDYPDKITLCDGEDSTLSIPHSFNQILWSDGDTAHIKTLKNEGYIYINYYGKCVNHNDSILITHIPTNSFSLGPDDTICFANPITLSGPDNFKYDWNDGSNKQTLQIQSEGIYWLQIIDNFGCSNYDTIQFTSSNASISIDIPNAFTPDQNGLNDQFPLKEMPIQARLQIFNRWGEIIYDSKTKPSWDGKVQEKNAPEGVYIYILSFRDCSNYPLNKTGNFQLLR